MSSKSKSKKHRYKILQLNNGEELKLSESMYLFAVTLQKTGSEEEARETAGWKPSYLKSRRKDIFQKIAPLIRQLQGEVEKRVVMDKVRVVEEISRIALANPLDYLHADGTPKQLHELTREQAAAVASFEVIKDKKGKVTTTYKLYDKPRALEMGGKHLGMFDARLILQGKIEHEHRHKHLALDLTKVPTTRLKQVEDLLRSEAENQGRIIEGQAHER